MINTLLILVLWELFILGSFLFLSPYSGESKAKTFATFSLFIAVLSLVYFPAITGHYIYHDDVDWWAWHKGNWATHPQYISEMFFLFRPLEVIVKYSMGSLVDHVNDADVVRFFTLIIIGLIASAMEIWFRKVCGALKRDSFLMSLAIVVLPPFQIYVYWMQADYMAVAIFLSICSSLLLLKVEQNDQDGPSVFRMRVLLSLFLLLCALLMYPPSALFMIALLAGWLIMADCRDVNSIKWPWLHLAVLFIAGGIFLFFFKILVPENAMGNGSIYSNALNFDYLGKFWWFIMKPLVTALNLWHIFPSRTVAGGVFLIIFSGILLEYLDLMKSTGDRGLFKVFLKKYGGILFLILLSSIVYLTHKQKVYFYRSIAFLTTIAFIFFWHGIKRILSVFFKSERYEVVATVVLFLICLCGMFTANATLREYCVDNNSRELRYLENELAHKYNSNIRRIHIIRPSGPPPQLSTLDEFGHTTCFFLQDVPWLVKAALRENGIFVHGLIVSSGTSKKFIAQDPHLLIIDLNKDTLSDPDVLTHVK